MASLRSLSKDALRIYSRSHFFLAANTKLRHQARSRTLFTGSYTPNSPLRKTVSATIFVLSAGLFLVYYFDARAALHRYVLTPALRTVMDAETAHQLAIRIIGSGLAPRDTRVDDERLHFNLWGRQISNPIGLAAGFDKNGEAIDGLFDLGFSWVEVGSVTPKPQPGNPTPRVFHLPDDEALINRYGFPSQGHIAVLARLRARIPTFFTPAGDGTGTASLRPGSILSVNLGKNKMSPPESIDDFVTGVRVFGQFADVLVVNVSSPNTPGLRGLQNRELLEQLLRGVIVARDQLPISPLTSGRPKLVLKISPDLDEPQIIDIADVIRHNSIDGVIVGNTTIRRPDSLTDANKIETGGLSGPPLKQYALQALRTLRLHLPASIPIIGCGGISSGADALDFARAGATLVQVYTHFGYDGAGTCGRIKDELVEELRRESSTWSEVVQRAGAEFSLNPNFQVENGESNISKLIEEAEGLKKMLDQLSDQISDGLLPDEKLAEGHSALGDVS